LRLAQLQLGRKPKQLIQEVKTRWNSLFALLQRLLEEFVPVVIAVRSTPSAAPLLWTQEEEEAACHLVYLLRYFDFVSTSVQSEKEVTISTLAKFVYTLRNEVCHIEQDDPGYLIQLKNKLADALKGRFWKEVNQKTIVALGLKLDPRFKEQKYFDEETDAVVLQTIRIALIESGESTALPLLQQSDDPIRDPIRELMFGIPRSRQAVLHNEWQRYSFEREQLPEVNPLDWWKERASTYPGLCTLVRKSLCVPATSCTSERTFSTAGLVASKKRSRLDAGLVDKLVFLNKTEI